MTKEIEIKVLNIDLEEMGKRLKNIGAKLISKEYQINTIFDTKDNYIENSLHGYLRIREIEYLLTGEKEIELTMKKNIDKTGARKNIETTVTIDDKKSMIDILNDLGYEIIDKGFKERTSYIYKNIRFDLDRWDEDTYLNPYMEIEVEKEEDLEEAIVLLKINKKNISIKSIKELKEEYKL